MPSKRKGGDLAIPAITEDPEERKRVLNILAQRRYRKRKKDHLHNLQKQVLEKSRDQEQLHQSSSATSSGSCNDLIVGDILPSQDEINAAQCSDTMFDLGLTTSTLVNMGSTTLVSSSSSSSSFSSTDIVNLPDLILSPSPPDSSSLIPPSSFPFPPDAVSFVSPSQTLLQTQVIPENDSYDETFVWLNHQHQHQRQQQLQHPETVLSDRLQMYQSSTFTFPDDHIIEVPSLTLLKAAMKVALRLNIGGALWDLTAISPFYTGTATQTTISTPSLDRASSPSSPPSTSTFPSPSLSPSKDNHDLLPLLPTHLRPTTTQRLIPHHPVLDILPWPTVRDKLIQVFNLPPALRPKAAQDPAALIRLTYDMEDPGGEGIVIRGSDPFVPDVWEIGQVVFERWWWAFETEIVDKSNRARKVRGKKDLMVSSL